MCNKRAAARCPENGYGRLKYDEELRWMKKISLFMRCLRTQVQDAKNEVKQTRAHHLEFLSNSGMELVLSEDEEEPDFASTFTEEQAPPTQTEPQGNDAEELIHHPVEPLMSDVQENTTNAPVEPVVEDAEITTTPTMESPMGGAERGAGLQCNRGRSLDCCC